MIAVCPMGRYKIRLIGLLRFARPHHLSQTKLRRIFLFMANRKGVFIGAYVPNELKESLRRRAAAEHRTLSQEITRILVEAVHGKGLPTGSVDRRNTTTIPRRRSSDPMPRRRSEDLPFIPSEDNKK
jgi:plasmid stability protein